MTKGRKTTYNERVEIVEFCIENNAFLVPLCDMHGSAVLIK